MEFDDPILVDRLEPWLLNLLAVYCFVIGVILNSMYFAHTKDVSSLAVVVPTLALTFLHRFYGLEATSIFRVFLFNHG